MRKTDLDLRGHTSGQFKTTCPLCSADRKKPTEACLAVNLDEGKYYCHNCEESGRLLDVIPTKAFAQRERSFNVPNIEEMTRQAVQLDDLVLDYFHSRGIHDQTILDCRISYGPGFRRVDEQGNPVTIDGIPQYDRAILFPFFEEGRLVWTKHLRPKEWCADGLRKIRSFKDGKPLPWGFDRAARRLVITEGEIDGMSIIESGIPEVWSVPNGAKAYGWLGFESVIKKLQETDEIYLALDNDEDGRAMTTELVRRLTELFGSPQKLNLVTYPDGCKDANDVLVALGPELLKKCILHNSVPVPVDGISEVKEFSDEFMNFYRFGLPKGNSTGIQTLDEIYRIMDGMVTIVSGVTNYGKSEFMDEIVRLQIELHSAKFAFYTPENAPQALHMIKVAEKFIGKPFDTERFGHMTEDEAQFSVEWMNTSMFYINPRNQTFSVDDILDRARVLIYRQGITGLIIDPWNYVRKDFAGLREDQFINNEMQKIVVFARATGVHVWVIVHPRTLRKNKEGKIEVPTVMELSGGSKFGDNADFLLVVHRNPQEAYETGIHKVVVYCQKSRYRPAAQQGSVTLEWEPFNGRFKELGAPTIAPIKEEFEHALEDGNGF